MKRTVLDQRRVCGWHLSMSREETLDGESRIVFEGGRQGSHAIVEAVRNRRGDRVEVSSAARVAAHWEGYREAHWPQNLAVGSRVRFASYSSPEHCRTGRVVRVTRTRVLVAYDFKRGPAAPKWIRKEELGAPDRSPWRGR